MGIAWSQGTIIYSETIRGDTKGNLATDLHAALTSAGWSSVAITDGYTYTLASPQSLGCKVKIWDRVVPGRPDLLTIQFLSLDETLVGYQHVLAVAPARFYQLHANRCQMFLSLAGISNQTSGDFNAVQGGIPFVPRDSLGVCGVDVGPLLTTEAWWSCGDTSGGGNTNLRNGRTGGPAWSACHNADVMNTETAAYSSLAQLRLAPLTLAVNVDFYPGEVQRARLFGGDPLYIDPLILWGSGAIFDSLALVRGQLYDAMAPTVDRAIDLKESLFGVDWVNYSHDDNVGLARTRHASLYLMRGVTPGEFHRGPYVY